MNIRGYISTNGGTPTYFGPVVSALNSHNTDVGRAAQSFLYVYVAPLAMTNQTDVLNNGIWTDNNHTLQFGGNTYTASNVDY